MSLESGVTDRFRADLAKKPLFLVAGKIDAVEDPASMDGLKQLAETRGLPFHAISSATGQEIPELKYAMAAVILDRAV